MDRKAVAERLRALASDDSKRSKAARLRDVIMDVESALAAGVSRSLVIEELANHGLVMSLSTFETTLKRMRKKRGRAENTHQTHKEPSPKAESQASMEEEKPAGVSHNPADLDAIFNSKVDLNDLIKQAKKRKEK